MRQFRFSVAALMAVIVLLAVGMAALRDPTTLWASAIFTAAVTLFAASVIGAMAHRGGTRLSWAGMSIFGWIYLIISFGPWPGNAVEPPPLLPSCLLDHFQDYIVSDGKTPYTTEERYIDYYKTMTRLRSWSPPTASLPGGFKSVDLTVYRQTGRSLGAMLFGILGAFAGRFFAARRERAANDGSGGV
jgi:hypothetical protein